MKPFNLELAKSCHPVCTRDGRDVRILCFDAKGICPIIALVSDNLNKEEVYDYFLNGRYEQTGQNLLDLFMKSEKKSVWKNFYKNHSGGVFTGLIDYNSEAEAKEHITCLNCGKYICTQLIEWEE